MKLITLVQVSDAEEEDERNIAKLLTVSYQPRSLTPYFQIKLACPAQDRRLRPTVTNADIFPLDFRSHTSSHRYCPSRL